MDGASCPAVAPPGKSLCTEHEHEFNVRRGSATARGYGVAHQKRRERLIPLAYGTLCPLCGEEMLYGQELHLDHTVPLATNRRSKGDRIVHGSCNDARRDEA